MEEAVTSTAVATIAAVEEQRIDLRLLLLLPRVRRGAGVLLCPPRKKQVNTKGRKHREDSNTHKKNTKTLLPSISLLLLVVHILTTTHPFY